MSVSATVFQVYLFLSTLLSTAVVMDKEDCFSTQDKLFLIDGYAHFRYHNDTYIKFVSAKEQCIFNDTAWYHLSLINISNVSNGTFVPTFDRMDLLRGAETKGAFK